MCDGERTESAGDIDAEKTTEGGDSEGTAQIARSAGLVGVFTLLSRIFGLVRDSVIAAFFDKGSTDAYFVAFTIPNVLRRLLAEGSLTVAFIPVFTEYREQRGEDAAREMLAAVLGAAILALVVSCSLGVLGAPWLVKLFAWGLTSAPARFDLAVTLTRIMFPFLLTVGLVALAMGALNTYRHFAAPAVAPVLLNLCIISIVVLASSRMTGLGLPPIAALGFGVLAGGAAQLALQLPFLGSRGLLVAPRLDLRHPGVIRVVRLMAPSLFALAIYQINVLLARLFASFLPEGSISALYYAQRLIEFPLGIFAVAVATVSMPSLSSSASSGELEQLKRTFGFALRVVMFVLLPATAGLVALAHPLAAVLFQRGEFTGAMARQTGATLIGFAVGIWAAGGVRQAAPAFYALQDTRTPVKVAALALLVYVVSAAALAGPLGTVGLALAVALSSTVNFSLLLLLLRRRIGRLGLSAVFSSAVKAGVAALACGGVAWSVARLGRWDQGGAEPSNYLLLVAAVLAGVMTYIALVWLLRAPELRELAKAFFRRRKR